MVVLLSAIGCVRKELSQPDRERRRVLALAEDRDARRLGEILADPKSDDLARATAAACLGKLPDGWSQREAILKALDDPSALVRRDAAEASGGLKLAEATGPISRLLRTDPDVDVRRASARALGRIGQSDSVDALIAALGDRDPGVATLASESLHSITGERFGTDRKAWENWSSSRTK